MSVDLIIDGISLDRPALDTQLRRYSRSYRRRLRKMAKSSARLGDLLYTYPAAAFVIAAHHGNPVLRGEALKLVKDGANLRKVGKCLGLPNWTRRLPPEAFADGFGTLPCSNDFNRQIVNLIPSDVETVSMWFHWVVKANALCHEDFALWMARQTIWDLGPDKPDIMLPMAAFVWFGKAEGTRGRGLIEKPWSPDLGFTKAIEATRGWFVRLLLEDCRDSTGRAGRWFVAQRASGYRIVPLRKLQDLEDEGRRMNNCVADYVTAVVSGECLIYSVRRGNEHVATLEVKPDCTKISSAIVAQLLGPDNDDVDEAVLRTVQSWLKRQGKYPFIDSGDFALAGFDAKRWNELWAPFWQANGKSKGMGGQQMPLQPIHVHRALEALSFYA